MNKKQILIIISLIFICAIEIQLYRYRFILKHYLVRTYQDIVWAKDNKEIKNIIAKEFPQINSNEISDFERVILLRQWVTKHIDWGSSHMMIHDQSFDNISLLQIYKYFTADKGAFNCGGSSEILSRLYNLYGYKSYRYDSGSNTTFNHIFTLVEINHHGEKILSIQDPSYDITYIHKNGKPYDFIDFLNTLKTNQADEIKILSGAGSPHEYICVKKDKCYPPIKDTPVIKLAQNKVKYLHINDKYQLEKNLKDKSYLNFKRIDSFGEMINEDMIQNITSAIY